jgi:hypothetical protein
LQLTNISCIIFYYNFSARCHLSQTLWLSVPALFSEGAKFHCMPKDQSNLLMASVVFCSLSTSQQHLQRDNPCLSYSYYSEHITEELNLKNTHVHYSTDRLRAVIHTRGLGSRSGEGTALLVGGSRDRSPVTGDFFWGIRQFHVPSKNEYQDIPGGIKTAGA